MPWNRDATRRSRPVRCGVFQAQGSAPARPDIVCLVQVGGQNPLVPGRLGTIYEHGHKGDRGFPFAGGRPGRWRCRKADEGSAGVAQRHRADQGAHPLGVAGPHLPQGQRHHHRQRQPDTGLHLHVEQGPQALMATLISFRWQNASRAQTGAQRRERSRAWGGNRPTARFADPRPAEIRDPDGVRKIPDQLETLLTKEPSTAHRPHIPPATQRNARAPDMTSKDGSPIGTFLYFGCGSGWQKTRSKSASML